MLKLLIIIMILGELFSIMSILYIDFFGTPEKLFTKYNYGSDEQFVLYLIAIFAGWAIFPFYIYCVYKQIQLTKITNRKE